MGHESPLRQIPEPQVAMTASRASTPSSPRFGCFLLHAHALDTEGGREVRVTLEDVGTGVKQRFETPEALNRFLQDWGWGRGRDGESTVPPRSP